MNKQTLIQKLSTDLDLFDYLEQIDSKDELESPAHIWLDGGRCAYVVDVCRLLDLTRSELLSALQHTFDRGSLLRHGEGNKEILEETH